MQNLVFADFTMKVTVEALVYFSIVLGLKANKSNLNGALQNILFLCNYQMFSSRPSPTLNWRRYSSLHPTGRRPDLKA